MFSVIHLVIDGYEAFNAYISKTRLLLNFSLRCLFERFSILKMPARQLPGTSPMTCDAFAEQHLPIPNNNDPNPHLRPLVFHTTEYTNTRACAIVEV